MHIRRVLTNYYNSSIDFGDEQYSIYFTNFSQTTQRVIDIQGEFSSSLTFLSITLRIGSVYDDFSQFIPEYFKTISGLELYRENPSFYNTQFKINGNINDIINQISKEDIEIKFNSNKYNI